MSLDITRQGPSSLQRASDAAGQEPPPPSPAAARRTTPAGQFPEIDDSTVGVVFVHGIGQQVRAEIVLDWSAPIVAAVAQWAAARPDTGGPDAGHTWNADRVVRSEIDFEGSDLPLVTIRVPGTTEDGHTFPPQTWVMTEARWAEHVRPPSLETMIDWCGPRGVVATVVARIIAHTMKDSSDALKALATMGLSTFVSVAVSIVLLGYAVLRTVAGIVPYKPLQDAIARVQLDTFLTAWWGDVYLLLDDPVQAANIRGQVNKTIRALRKYGCQRIVVVAHSGCTIVSYMALSDPAATEEADTFITHGEAIEMGRYIHRTEGRSSTSPGAQIEPGKTLRGITRWHDFYGTHDPAPAGRLTEAASPGAIFRDTEVWNRMSIAQDHGEYFSNDEEFVNGVLCDIETAGQPAAPSRFAAGNDAWVHRRHQRVYILALWVRLTFVLPLLGVMGAFLLPSTGLIPGMSDAAYRGLSFVPGSTELAAAIRDAVPPPGNGLLVDAAAALVGVFAIFAIVQAVLPIGRSNLWTGPRRVFFLGLDAGFFVAAVAVAWVARSVEAGDPVAAFRELVARLQDPPVLAAIVISFAIFLVLATDRVRLGIARFGLGQPTATRTIVLVGALAAIALFIYGLAVDDGIRMMVVGTAVAIVVFQVLGRIGAWRWRIWDAAERSAARRRSVPVARLQIWLEFLSLGAVAAAFAAAIAIGWIQVGIVGAQVLVGLLAVFVVADVIQRRAT